MNGVHDRLASGLANIDAGRHAMERIAPAAYLTLGDCGRWLRSLETLLLEAGVLAEGELDARIEGQELWGDQAVPRSFVQPDLFESHLEAEA